MKIRDILREQGVAEEGYGTHPSQRVDPRTGKKYVPPKSPLGKGVAEGPVAEMNANLWDKGYHKSYPKRDPIKDPTRTFVEIARMFNITGRQLQGLTLNYPGFPAPVKDIGKAARGGKHNYYELNQVMQWIRDHDLSDRVKSYAKLVQGGRR